MPAFEQVQAAVTEVVASVLENPITGESGPGINASAEQKSIAESMELSTLTSNTIDALETCSEFSNLSQAEQDNIMAIVEGVHEDHQFDHAQAIMFNRAIYELIEGQLASPCQSLNRSEIIQSTLELIANGPENIGQGLVASCTATASLSMLMEQDLARFTKLTSDLLLHGESTLSGTTIHLNESGVRHEAGTETHNGASVVECMLRSSVMDLACEGIENTNPGLEVTYDDASGTCFVFREGELVKTFQGMSAEGWVHAQEVLLGHGMEHVNMEGADKTELIAEFMKNGSTLMSVSYAESGIHNKHYLRLTDIVEVDGELYVYFDNPHSDITADNFDKIAPSHELVPERNLERIKLSELDVLNFSRQHKDLKPGDITQDFGAEHFETILASLEQSSIPADLILILQNGPETKAGTSKISTENQQDSVFKFKAANEIFEAVVDAQLEQIAKREDERSEEEGAAHANLKKQPALSLRGNFNLLSDDDELLLQNRREQALKEATLRQTLT